MDEFPQWTAIVRGLSLVTTRPGVWPQTRYTDADRDVAASVSVRQPRLYHTAAGHYGRVAAIQTRTNQMEVELGAGPTLRTRQLSVVKSGRPQTDEGARAILKQLTGGQGGSLSLAACLLRIVYSIIL